jgi:hypothetical protein
MKTGANDFLMASLPPGRKTLPPGWWRGEFEPGTTLLARELTRQFRRRRRLKPQDERLQREARAYARWMWGHAADELPEPGHA